MGLFRGPNIVTDGLVLALDAGSARSYPGSGTTWYDISDNNIDFIDRSSTITDFVSASPYSFDFDGTNDRFRKDSPEVVVFGGTYDFTWEAWVNPDVTTSLSGVFGRRSLADDILGISSGAVYISRGTTAGAVTGGAVVSGQWNHIVGTGNSTTLYVYHNGVFKNSGGHTTPFTGTFLNWYVGCKHDAYGEGSLTNPLNGKVSVVRVYNRPLSSTEILQNYNSQKSRFGL